MNRHKMIYPVIGAFEQEKEAYLLVTQMYWLLPAIIVLATLTDLGLVWLYEKIGHPWKEILAQETQVRVQRGERDLRQVILQVTVIVNSQEDREEEIAEGEDIPMVEMERGHHEVEDDVVTAADVEMRFHCESQSQSGDQTQGVAE